MVGSGVRLLDENLNLLKHNEASFCFFSTSTSTYTLFYYFATVPTSPQLCYHWLLSFSLSFFLLLFFFSSFSSLLVTQLGVSLRMMGGVGSVSTVMEGSYYENKPWLIVL
ncbi:hypothetical protein MN608_05150 [Microdochium nivale]|nr:hypothetical protein MN608_05150 [Microdochium nivale]